jgi:hypothetical protein
MQLMVEKGEPSQVPHLELVPKAITSDALGGDRVGVGTSTIINEGKYRWFVRHVCIVIVRRSYGQTHEREV